MLGDRVLVMGILNVTPDSFADADRQMTAPRAIDAALRLADEGADLIDVGGESTRPGAEPVSEAEERRRVLPVIEALQQRLAIPISIDTYKAAVARAALDAGAALINDISGLRFDPALAAVAARAGAPIVLMHSRGRPQTMNDEAEYGDLVAEVIRELRDAVARALAAGVAREGIVVDPGVGFAKRAAHSYGVLARLPEIAAALDRPVLIGPSRKSFLREALSNRPAIDRDWGTAAVVAAAVLNGAHIVRVHAVGAMAQVVRVAEQIRRYGHAAHG